MRGAVSRFAATMGLLALAASSVLAGPALSAAAAPAAAVTIERTSPSPQESGNTFVYALQYQCSDVNGPGCADNVITIPLGAAAGFGYSVSTGAPVVSSAIVGTDLVITLDPSIPDGTSSTINLSLTPPNNTTPNGTTWSLLPVVTGTNTPTSNAPTAADGTATAVLNPSISKTVSPGFVRPGEAVTWTVTTGCYTQASGNLYAQSMTVSDPLPAGFELVSASGGGVESGNTVTWTYPDAASLPASCTDGSTATISQTITGIVSASHPAGTSIVNNATVSAVPFGGGDPVTAVATAKVTVYDDINPPGESGAVLSKLGQGQLAGPAPFNPNYPGDFQNHHSLTYPGNWMGVPREASLGDVIPGGYQNATTQQNWSGYTSQIAGLQGDGYQAEFRDKMPCIDNYTDPVYLESAAICQNPAFHATMITVYDQTSVAGAGSWAYNLQPYAILSDGSTVNLEPQAVVAANYAQVYYYVPTAAIGQVSEIVVPRDPGSQGFIKRIYIGGYADKSIQDGSILENTSRANLYWGNGTAPTDTLTSNPGKIFVINAPQIGATKSFGAVGAAADGATAMTLGATLGTIGEPSEDLVIADLLPEGMMLADATSPSTVAYSIITGDDSGQTTDAATQAFPLEVIDNYQGSGRQLVRITVSQAFLETKAGMSIGGESGTNYTFSAPLTVTTPTEPGIYNNRSAVFYDRDDVSEICRGPIAQNPDDVGDLDGNDDTTDVHCDATASLTIPGSVPGPGFSLKKTVQGDSDAFPKGWPSVARVSGPGGTVDFGLVFKNTATDPLNGVVLYDIFPKVGDMGVSQSLANQPRKSDFAALLTSVGALPAGVTVEYSTDANPCRDEVFPNASNATCVDDWSATAPADVTTVTGLRVISTATYASGEGFTVNVMMTVPSIDAGDIAWNSVAGRANDANTDEALLASEPAKVGVTAVGTDLPPLIQKTVDKATAVPGDTLTYTMKTVNLDVVRLTGLTAVDTLPAGVTFVSADNGGVYDAASGTITWSDLTLESGEAKTFTVQVTVNPGVSGALVNKYTLDDAEADFECPDEPGSSCATTTIPGSELIVTKAVTGDAAEYAAGPYTVIVDCVANGASAPGFPQNVIFPAAGDSDPIPAPTGAQCTATETVTGGATEVMVTPADGVTVGGADAAPAAITVTNDFRAGSLVISKALDGAGAADFGNGPFTFGVVCSFNGADDVYTTEVKLQRAADESVLTSDPITGLPVGAECIVTETDNGGADATPAPVTITIVENDAENTVTAMFLNEFSAGVISLSKVVDGAGAETPEALESAFIVQVTCEVVVDGVTGTLFSGAVEITAGETVEIEDADGNALQLPLGAHCWGVETDQGGASAAVVNFDSYENAAIVADGTPSDLQQLELVATNTFTVAELVITKTVVGPGAAGPYSFEVVCTRDGVDYTLSKADAEFTLSHGESRTIVVGTGVDCVVVEVSPPTGATVSMLDSDESSTGGATDGVVLAITGEARVDITNTFAEPPVVTPPVVTPPVVTPPVVTPPVVTPPVVTPPGVTPPGVQTPVLVNTGLVVGGGIAAGAVLLLMGGALMFGSRVRRRNAEANR